MHFHFYIGKNCNEMTVMLLLLGQYIICMMCNQNIHDIVNHMVTFHQITPEIASAIASTGNYTSRKLAFVITIQSAFILLLFFFSLFEGLPSKIVYFQLFQVCYLHCNNTCKRTLPCKLTVKPNPQPLIIREQQGVRG